MSQQLEVIFMTRSKELARGVLKESWAPFNYREIIRVLPLRTRVYFLGSSLIYFPVTVRLKLERREEKAYRPGHLIIMPYLNCVAVTLEEWRAGRYEASPLGIINSGFENLKKLKRGDIVLIKASIHLGK